MLTYHSFQQINMIVNTTIFFHFLYVGPLWVSCYKHSGLTLCLWNYNAAVNIEQNFFFFKVVDLWKAVIVSLKELPQLAKSSSAMVLDIITY